MAKTTKECPFCGAEVKKENFNRHLLKAHKDAGEKEFGEKGMSKPAETVDRKRLEREVEIREELQKRKRKGRLSTAILVVAIFVVVILVGAIMYQNIVPNTGGGGGGNGSRLPVAVMTTTLGVIMIQLYTDKAPGTAGNFINLAKSGFYSGVTFHRAEPGFVIQGGGYTSSGQPKSASSIPWENTGIKNLQWTLSMARSGGANDAASSGTATSQFFVNLNNNPNLDGYTYPYVVFGIVIDGYSVVDAIASLQTHDESGIKIIDNQPVINSVVIQY
jgi:cyclophilin family peptidyl-prolyl cis-trans isomerase